MVCSPPQTALERGTAVCGAKEAEGRNHSAPFPFETVPPLFPLFFFPLFTASVPPFLFSSLHRKREKDTLVRRAIELSAEWRDERSTDAVGRRRLG